MLIDVITLTYNNCDELMRTIRSMSSAISHIGNIYVIYDGDCPNLEFSRELPEVAKKINVIKGPGQGIYGAMNAAITIIENDYIFINAGDQIVGNPFMEVRNFNTPLMFSCNGINVDEKIKAILPNRSIMKFNHNSVIFPKNFREQYNKKYKIAADFDLMLRLTQQYGFPKYFKTSGHTLYDLSGISSTKKATRDFEYYQISRFHKKPLLAFYYLIKYFLIKAKGYS